MDLAPIGSAKVTATTSTRSSRMPAEWTPHERCLMAWPTRPELWHGQYEAATAEYAAVAQAIARFEPVLMVAAPGSGDDARTGVDFRFNAWGERFFPYDDDDRFPERVLAYLGIPCQRVEMVLEGG